MKILIIAFFTLCLFSLHAQVGSDLRAADVIALNAPDSVQSSVDGLGRYFSRSFSSQKFRARAIFSWTAMEISYDIANISKVNNTTGFDELVEKTMQTKSAVCQGYTAVFKALCDKCGIRAYVVNGYTRQNGHINDISHSWIIAVIDSMWYGFDPTWGGGYMIRGKYVRHFNEGFFMIKPEVLINDHMPFDPMWECLDHPVNNQDFTNGRIISTVSSNAFAWSDSIAAWQGMSVKDQCQASLRRLEIAGITNNLLQDWAKYLGDCITNGKLNVQATARNKYVKQFNDAVASYNQSIYLFNQYIDYWNRRFTPLKPELEIVEMLDSCYYYLNSSKKSLSQVLPQDEDMQQGTEQLQQAINLARENMDKQKVFLKIYFNTSPEYRIELFKNYNGAGFPTNK
jgi:hypothetical protein